MTQAINEGTRCELRNEIAEAIGDAGFAADAALAVVVARFGAIANALDDEARDFATLSAGSEDIETRVRLDVKVQALRGAARRIRAELES